MCCPHTELCSPTSQLFVNFPQLWLLSPVTSLSAVLHPSHNELITRSFQSFCPLPLTASPTHSRQPLTLNRFCGLHDDCSHLIGFQCTLQSSAKLILLQSISSFDSSIQKSLMALHIHGIKIAQSLNLFLVSPPPSFYSMPSKLCHSCF